VVLAKATNMQFHWSQSMRELLACFEKFGHTQRAQDVGVAKLSRKTAFFSIPFAIS